MQPNQEPIKREDVSNMPTESNGGDFVPGDMAAGQGDEAVHHGHEATEDEESPFEFGVDPKVLRAEEKGKQILLNIVKRKQEKADAAEEIRRSEPDLVKRAKALAKDQHVNFPDAKFTQEGWIALNTEMNRYAAFSALFGEGDDRPCLDDFLWKVVDHKKKEIDQNYDPVTLLSAVDALGLKGQDGDQLVKKLRSWALKVRRNTVTERMMKRVPPWDGVPRIETALIDIFEPKKTELNRKISKYFWLSLYSRMVRPGANAPIVVTLIGTQLAGKSYFAKVICEEIMDDKNADVADFHIDMNKDDFLRKVTGQSPIAMAAEMAGVHANDLNSLKQFVAKSSDFMRHLYKDYSNKPRQWIIMMDGNGYDGLQRDKTGNRRFYPLFVGQTDDVDGQPAWKGKGLTPDDPDWEEKRFKANLSTLREDFWQYMAEAAAWLDEHGEKAYDRFVTECADDVFKFSANEMERGRGAVEDPVMDMYLPRAVAKALSGHSGNGEFGVVWLKRARVDSKRAVAIEKVHLFDIYKRVSGERDANAQRFPQQVKKLGFVEVKLNNTKAFVYECNSIEEMKKLFEWKADWESEEEQM